MTYLLDNKLVLTILILLIGFAIKVTVCRFYKRKFKRKGLDKRYLINNFNNLFNLLMLLILMALWAEELQRFALSIAAFVVAIVLATKEIIQCFIGFFYITASAPFRVGDWIQTNEITGEVSQIDWAKVVLLEVDRETYSYTGRTVFLPNSALMLQPIKNLNYMRRYVNHSFSITYEAPTGDVNSLIESLEIQAMAYCADFADVAERYNTLIENRLDVTIAGPKPTVQITTTDTGKVKLNFNLFCPTEKAIEIEQQLTKDFFNFSMAK
ncbi:mechanosensitive ion channel [Thalassotalea sp. LPB0316]|uniref:mechanosensitive ion channel family protein n=1 Tax=Thalassotalea sp. LPB0316 TaxID=2769490 RepID=UPI001866D288|nr:mechanosensitive ion channel domain-containing protein [Thalassotalea sp. LPB0316]QOL25644.1 mechanosensitive ion channel [Thalassotalea sp. LPB0316]